MSIQPNKELDPDTRVKQAKEKLQQLHIWLDHPITLEILDLVEKQAYETLLTVARIPQDPWDQIAREQDAGHVKGLLEFRNLIQTLKNELQQEADGKFEGPETITTEDLNEALKYPGQMGTPL